MSFRIITAKINSWRRYRAAVRELSLLSDRELSELGIERSEIERLARRASI